MAGVWVEPVFNAWFRGNANPLNGVGRSGGQGAMKFGQASWLTAADGL